MFGKALPTAREDRWRLLDEFLAKWFPAPREAPGVPSSDLVAAEQRLGRPLPAALREWYARYGARADIWSVQDRLLMPKQLRVERDTLLFCVENQSVVVWGIRLDDLSLADPPVVVSDPDGGKGWFVESRTFSEFALQFVLMNVKWSERIRSSNGSCTKTAFIAVDQAYKRLPVGEMQWPAWPTRFYGNAEIVIETNGDTWIWASARSRQALDQLDSLVRASGMDTWELYDGE